MCEVILVNVQCVAVKLLALFHNNNHKKCQRNCFQNECCSINQQESSDV